jgi:hypothetical protein
VKYHLSQLKASQFVAKIALEANEVLEEVSVAAAEEVSAAVTEDSMMGQERCIKLSAMSVSKNVKFHSSQQKVSQSTVRNALEIEKKKKNSNLG